MVVASVFMILVNFFFCSYIEEHGIIPSCVDIITNMSHVPSALLAVVISLHCSSHFLCNISNGGGPFDTFFVV